MSDRPHSPTHKPIPDDAVIRRRTIIAVVAGVVLVALLVAGSWFLFGRGQDTQTAQSGSFEPAQDTSAPISVDTTGSEEPSASAETTSADAASTAVPEPGEITVAPKMAFRLGNTLYMANEDGTDAVAVASSSAGPYALSPDGTAIAWVERSTQELSIAPTSGSGLLTAGKAADVRPVWFRDSSAVLFRRQDTAQSLAPQVMRVKADGGTAIVTGTGRIMAAGDDGTVLLGPAAEEGDLSRQLVIVRGAQRTQIQAPGTVSGIAVASDHILVAVSEPPTAAGIWRYDLEGRKRERVYKGLPKDEVGAITDLAPSPDGAMLAFAVTGDDGYSRLYSIPSDGGKPVNLSIRRDGYPLGWTANSTAILFIEGNAFQGESTALMRVNPDGSARYMIVGGASL